MAVFSGVRKNHVSALCGQNVEFLNVKTVGTYCNCCYLL